MKERLHDMRGTKLYHVIIETVGDKNFGKLKGIHQIHQTFYRQSFLLYSTVLYTWNYWRVDYLAIRSKNAVGEIFIWWF